MAISNPSLAQIKQALTEMLPKLKPLSVPTGMISAFHTVPDGWLQCNGAAVSRTTYAALFAVIGTKYGSGDGSTTFNLPNLHHKFIEGTTTSSEVGRSVSAGLPNISGEGDWVFGGYASTGTFTGSMYHVSLQNLPGATGGNDYYNGKPGIGIDASRSSSIYKASSTVQPASVRLLACIKI
jgi:hypothetical protein